MSNTPAPVMGTQDTGAPAIVSAESLDKDLSDVLERKRISKAWKKDNFEDEWIDAWRQTNARAIQIKDEKSGKEDASRSNIVTADAWIIARRKTARLAARPPNIKVRAENDVVSDWLSAYTAYSWDRSGEQSIQRRHVLQSQIFGLSIKHHWYDKIQNVRRFRVSSEELLKRRGALRDTGNGELRLSDSADYEPDPENPDQYEYLKYDSMSSSDRASVLAKMGPEGTDPTTVLKYEGPVSSWVFLGDFYPEPEFTSLHEAAWITIDRVVDSQWLLYMTEQQYEDPRDGQMRPALLKDKVAEMVEAGPWPKKPHDQRDEDFAQRLKSAIYKTSPNIRPDLMPGKRYLITSEYTMREGWCWVRFCGNERFMLGEIPLPWDLYGHYPFSSLTPIPHLMHGVGDSSIRVLRHLLRLNNVSISQRTDMVTNALKPLVLLREGADIPPEVMDRGAYRVIYVKSPNDVEYAPKAEFPPEAWELAKDIQIRLQQGEPILIDFGSTSQAQPLSSQTATQGVLQARAGESLQSDELEQLNESISQETEIKLFLLQQALNDKMELPAKYFTEHTPKDTYNALNPGTESQPRQTIMHPLDLQVEFEVFPEAYSTLSLSDEAKRADAATIYSLAIQNPEIWNVHQAAHDLANTFRGRTAEGLVNPPTPPAPTPPEPKLSVSLQIKWTELEPQVQQAILGAVGLPGGVAPELDQANQVLAKARQAGEHLGALTGDQPQNGDQGQ